MIALNEIKYNINSNNIKTNMSNINNKSIGLGNTWKQLCINSTEKNAIGNNVVRIFYASAK